MRFYDVKTRGEAPRLIGRLRFGANKSSRSVSSAHMRGLAGSEPVFQYDAAWLDDGFSIGADLPLVTAPQRPAPGHRLFAFLEDRALPTAVLPLYKEELVDQRLIEGASDDEALSVLLPDSGQSFGAAAIYPSGTSETPAAEPVSVAAQMDDLVYSAHAYERGKARLNECQLLRRAVTLPGPKLRFAMDRSGEPVEALIRTLSDETDLPLWRHFSLVLAERCGIRCVKSELLHQMGESVLVSSRADRGGDARPLFALTGAALSVHPSGEPGARRAPGILELADILNREGASPSEDLPQLFRRMLFRLLTGSAGITGRETLFTREAYGWRLAPAQGFALGETAGVQLTADGRRPIPSTDAAVTLSRYFGVSSRDAKAMLSDMKRVLSGWDAIAVEVGADAREIAYMSQAFQTDF
jgi:serine/threonine-protein kinase HipA